MSKVTPDITKDRLLDEFNTVVNETENLLKSVAGMGTEQAGMLKANVDQAIVSASDQIAQIRKTALAQASAAAQATDEYVQGNPWRAVGIVAGLAAITGLLAGLLIARSE
jgi:ElaB/YqjD/DUF883 family membrane-anchored ribosome-binding protein